MFNPHSPDCVIMKKREECTCACHNGEEILHFVPCCDNTSDLTEEQINQWVKEYQRFGFNIERDKDKLKKNNS